MVRTIIRHLFSKDLLKSKSKLLVKIMLLKDRNKELTKRVKELTHQRQHFKDDCNRLRMQLLSKVSSNRHDKKDKE